MRVLLIAAALLAACDSPSAPDYPYAVPEEIVFPAALGVDLAQMNKTESGLYWQDMIVGTGDAVVIEDEVVYHLTIWLPDGRQVFSTRTGLPEVELIRLLIPGLAEGMLGMQPGGTRKLVIRPELAWPNGKPPDIKPLTTLVCEVDLVSIR